MRHPLPPRCLTSINTIRIVAAVHIVNGHLFEGVLVHHGTPTLLTVLFASSASFSTSLFFVLSGMVLAYSNQRRESASGQLESPRRKFFRHVRRGVPYLIIGALLAAAGDLWSGSPVLPTLGNFCYSISLVPPFLFDTPSLNVPAWAMSVFVLGYFIDAYFGRKLASLSTTRLLVAILAILFLTSIFMLLYVLLIPTMPAYPPRLYGSVAIQYHVFPLFRIMEVLLGMFIGSLLYRHYWEIRTAIRGSLLTNDMIWALLAILNMVCLTLLCRAGGREAFLATHGLLLAPMSLMLVAIAVDDNWAGRIGLTRIFRFLANLSLPVYLLHFPLYRYYGLLLDSLGIRIASTSWGFVAGFFIMLATVSFAVMSLVHCVLRDEGAQDHGVPTPVEQDAAIAE